MPYSILELPHHSWLKKKYNVSQTEMAGITLAIRSGMQT